MSEWDDERPIDSRLVAADRDKLRDVINPKSQTEETRPKRSFWRRVFGAASVALPQEISVATPDPSADVRTPTIAKETQMPATVTPPVKPAKRRAVKISLATHGTQVQIDVDSKYALSMDPVNSTAKIEGSSVSLTAKGFDQVHTPSLAVGEQPAPKPAEAAVEDEKVAPYVMKKVDIGRNSDGDLVFTIDGMVATLGQSHADITLRPSVVH